MFVVVVFFCLRIVELIKSIFIDYIYYVEGIPSKQHTCKVPASSKATSANSVFRFAYYLGIVKLVILYESSFMQMIHMKYQDLYETFKCFITTEQIIKLKFRLLHM